MRRSDADWRGRPDPIAVWGAITGTLAIAIQAVQAIGDRPRLVMSIDVDFDKVAIVLTNMGRRPVSVRKIAAGLTYYKFAKLRFRPLRRRLRQNLGLSLMDSISD